MGQQWANSGPTVGQTWRRGMVRMARMTHSRRCRRERKRRPSPTRNGRFRQILRVRADRLELSTSGLRVRCSTIELCPRAWCETSSVFSETEATRTPDLRVRSPALYPTELRSPSRGDVNSGRAACLSSAACGSASMGVNPGGRGRAVGTDRCLTFRRRKCLIQSPSKKPWIDAGLRNKCPSARNPLQV